MIAISVLVFTSSAICLACEPPEFGRYCTRTLNPAFVTAIAASLAPHALTNTAWQSRGSGVMDCFTAFAMTRLFVERVFGKAMLARFCSWSM